MSEAVIPTPRPAIAPRPIPTSSEPLPETPKTSALDELACAASDQAVAAGAGKLEMSGESFRQALETQDDPEAGCDVIDKLARAFGGLCDKVYAILACFGIKREEADASQQKIEDREKYDTQEPAPSDWRPPEVETPAGARQTARSAAGEKIKLPWADWNRAQHAKKKLNENPEWRVYIKNSAQRHKVPGALIVSIIEMESGFNNGARNKDSGAAGLSQVVGRTLTAYKRHPNGAARFMRETGKTEIDPLDPETGIDIAAWVIRSKIMTTQVLPPQYRLTVRPIGPDDPVRMEDITSVEDLYLTYNSGTDGYRKWRDYEKNPTQENFDRLHRFQRENLKERQLRRAYNRNKTRENFDAWRQFKQELAQIRQLQRQYEQSSTPQNSAALNDFKQKLETKYQQDIASILRCDGQDRLAYARRVERVAAAVAADYA